MQYWLKQQQLLLAQMSHRLCNGDTDAYKSTGFLPQHFFIPKASGSNYMKNRFHVFAPLAEVKESSIKGSDFRTKDVLSQSDKKKESKVVYDLSAYNAPSLSEEDLHKMIGLYGNRIENVYELSAGQQWMLETSKRVRSAFFLQILTKAVVPLDPAAFRQRADEVCEKYESLRSAFVYRKVSKPYRVVLKDRQPEINYFDLSDYEMNEFDEKLQKAAESDRSRGFDLEKDHLLRINVYKSCEKDTYAIIISQPHINSDGTSLALLFSDLFVGYAMDMNGIDKKIKAQSYEKYADYLNNIDSDKELSYWKDKLESISKDQLMLGQQKNELDYESTSYFVPFTEEDQLCLKHAQKLFRVTQFTLLQGLWGIMISRLKNRNDFVFGVVTSGRDAAVIDSMNQAGGFINVLPVNVRFEKDELIADYMKKLHENFMEAMEHSHCSPKQIEHALNRTETLFGHLLNSHNFARPKNVSFSGSTAAGIKLLEGEAYDNLSEDLCVYFTTVNGEAGCNYSYNANAFSKSIIQLYAEFFKEMISSLKDVTIESRIDDLPQADSERIHEAEEASKALNLKIAVFLKKHSVFGCVQDAELISLAGKCRLKTYSEDEIIVVKEQYLDEIPILLNGKAVMYGLSKSGWENPIQILHSGSVLSYTGMLEGVKNENLIASTTSDTEVLFVPKKEMLAFCAEHPAASFAIMRQLEGTKNKYMRLWLNAE